MNTSHLAAAGFLIVTLAISGGCNSKQPSSTAPAGNKESAAPTNGQAQPQNQQAASVPAQDMTAARAEAIKILSHLEGGNFAHIYRGASQGFKQIGPEAAFVTRFQQTYQKTGPLKNPREISFTTRPGGVLVFVYRVENDRFSSDMRLSFQKSADGVMQLAGLNQHDEPKKKLK